MRAAILHEHGKPPEPGDFEDPAPAEGQVVVDVEAAGLNPVDLSIASGSYFAGAPPLPSVVGREGVGRTDDGTLVYFDRPAVPYGSFAERASVDRSSLIPLPVELDPALATCFGIAGLAAWLALEWRARVTDGETVLVLGASGVVGQIAVQAARLLGAGRVVAAARDRDLLAAARERGADATVEIGAVDDLAGALREACGGDGPNVVVDPLWGEPAAAAIEACAPRARLVQLGQSAGAEASLRSAAIRGKLLAILGHVNWAAPDDVKRPAYERMVEHAAAGRIEVDVERVPLEEVAGAWRRQQQSPHHKIAILP